MLEKIIKKNKFKKPYIAIKKSIKIKKKTRKKNDYDIFIQKKFKKIFLFNLYNILLLKFLHNYRLCL